MVRRKWDEEKPFQVLYQATVEGNTQSKPKFYCENQVIPHSQDLELLEVTTDDKLKFDKHVAKVCKNASAQIAVLKHLRNLIPFEIRNIYMLFITPHFNYYSKIWHFCNKSVSGKIEKVNVRVSHVLCFQRQKHFIQ